MWGYRKAANVLVGAADVDKVGSFVGARVGASDGFEVGSFVGMLNGALLLVAMSADLLEVMLADLLLADFWRPSWLIFGGLVG